MKTSTNKEYENGESGFIIDNVGLANTHNKENKMIGGEEKINIGEEIIDDNVSINDDNDNIDSDDNTIDGHNDDDSDDNTSDSDDDNISEVDNEDDYDKDNDDNKNIQKGGKNASITPSELIQKFMEQDENIVDDEDDDEEEYYSDEDYVKFDKEINEDQVLNYHNDLLQSNFDEISALTKIARNKEGIIVDPLHKTIPILTKFERARILGLRAKQLANGAEPFIKIEPNIIQNHIISEMELEQNVLPFIVCRPLPNGRKEYWRLQDLEQIDY